MHCCHDKSHDQTYMLKHIPHFGGFAASINENWPRCFCWCWQKASQFVHEASSPRPPATPFIPWGSLRVRIHKSPAETTSAKYPTRDRTAGPLISLECVSLCMCVRDKKKVRKENNNVNEDVTEHKRKRERREGWKIYINSLIHPNKLLCPAVTASYRVTLCSQNGHQCPGKTCPANRKITMTWSESGHQLARHTLRKDTITHRQWI